MMYERWHVHSRSYQTPSFVLETSVSRLGLVWPVVRALSLVPDTVVCSDLFGCVVYIWYKHGYERSRSYHTPSFSMLSLDIFAWVGYDRWYERRRSYWTPLFLLGHVGAASLFGTTNGTSVYARTGCDLFLWNHANLLRGVVQPLVWELLLIPDVIFSSGHLKRHVLSRFFFIDLRG